MPCKWWPWTVNIVWTTNDYFILLSTCVFYIFWKGHLRSCLMFMQIFESFWLYAFMLNVDSTIVLHYWLQGQTNASARVKHWVDKVFRSELQISYCFEIRYCILWCILFSWSQMRSDSELRSSVSIRVSSNISARLVQAWLINSSSLSVSLIVRYWSKSKSIKYARTRHRYIIRLPVCIFAS